MKIVVHMRDEAHRFSRRLHHKKEKSRIITSWVEEVRGLNESVRTEILRVNTMSLEELREFNMKSLQDYLGINSKHARAVYEFLHAIDKKN